MNPSNEPFYGDVGLHEVSHFDLDASSQLGQPQIDIIDPDDDDVDDPEYLLQAWVQDLTAKPHRTRVVMWVLNGAGGGMIAVLPFGPGGLLLGLVCGIPVGIVVGLIFELIRRVKRRDTAARNKRLITHLMRWANYHFASAENQLQLVFLVVARFHAITTLAEYSTSAKSQVKLLHKFISRPDVQQCLFVYLDNFYRMRHSASRYDIAMCATTCKVCIKACQLLPKRGKPDVVVVMEGFMRGAEIREVLKRGEELQRRQEETAVRRDKYVIYGDKEAQKVMGMPLPPPTQVVDTGDGSDISSEPIDDIETDDGIEMQHVAAPVALDNGFKLNFKPGSGPQPYSPRLTSGGERFSPRPGPTSDKDKSPPGTMSPHASPDERVGSVCSLSSIDGRRRRRQSQMQPMHPVPFNVSIPMTQLKEESICVSRTESTSKIKQNRKSQVVIPPSPINIPVQREPSEVSRAPPVETPQMLFRSYTDMINFDVDLKHQTPISTYEMRFLNEKYEHDPKDPKWECVCNNKDIRVYKITSADSPVVLIKAYAIIPNMNFNVVAHQIRHIPSRIAWDKVFAEYKIIEKHVDGCEMIYCSMKAPFPVSNRDFLQWRRTEIDETTKTVRMILRSASHPSVSEKGGTIRAETLISGYIVSQQGSSCEVFILAQTDVKGFIPKWVVNSVASKSPVSWTSSLRKACEDYVKKNGDRVPLYAT